MGLLCGGMMMDSTVRKVQLSQSAMERLKADIEADDADLLGEMVASLLAKLALRRIRAWQEIMRIAEVNEEVETVRLSFLTNEILVMPKSKHESA
jgi:hypothetical protein